MAANPTTKKKPVKKELKETTVYIFYFEHGAKREKARSQIKFKEITEISDVQHLVAAEKFLESEGFKKPFITDWKVIRKEFV